MISLLLRAADAAIFFNILIAQLVVDRQLFFADYFMPLPISPLIAISATPSAQLAMIAFLRCADFHNISFPRPPRFLYAGLRRFRLFRWLLISYFH